MSSEICYNPVQRIDVVFLISHSSGAAGQCRQAFTKDKLQNHFLRSVSPNLTIHFVQAPERTVSCLIRRTSKRTQTEHIKPQNTALVRSTNGHDQRLTVCYDNLHQNRGQFSDNKHSFMRHIRIAELTVSILNINVLCNWQRWSTKYYMTVYPRWQLLIISWKKTANSTFTNTEVDGEKGSRY